MPDPTLPRRPWEGGDRQIQIDKNGIARAVYVNPNEKQEDSQRYERKKNFEKAQDSGYFDVSGATSRPGPLSGGVPPAQSPATSSSPVPNWLLAMKQRYASELPIHLSLDKNAPIVTPEMLVPTDEQLMQMDEDTREGIGRVFLTLAMRYYGDSSMRNAVLYGTRIKGLIPAQILAEYRHIVGR